MNDFTHWLYASYIHPQLKNANATGYETALSLMDTTMDDQLKKHYERAVEFYATRAFLLGLRTGAGLSGTFKG